MQMRVLVVVVCAGFLVGCNGGTVDRHALTNDSATVDSMACEGALLAHNLAAGKTTRFFAREQAAALRVEASNLADALATRRAVPAIEARVRAKAKVAARVASILRRLHDHPSSDQVAVAVERQLKQIGSCP
jgi:hypothetical protein